jgi:hypothetical protein
MMPIKHYIKMPIKHYINTDTYIILQMYKKNIAPTTPPQLKEFNPPTYHHHPAPSISTHHLTLPSKRLPSNDCSYRAIISETP